MGLGKLLLIPGSLEDGFCMPKTVHMLKNSSQTPWNNLRPPANKEKLEQACKQCTLYNELHKVPTKDKSKL